MRPEAMTQPDLQPSRGSPVVCVPVTINGIRHWWQALRPTIHSLAVHTDGAAPIVLAAVSAEIHVLSEQLEADDLSARLALMPLDDCVRSTCLLNDAIQACAPSDIAFVVPGVQVDAGWLVRLQAAAYSDSTVASASPLFYTVTQAARRITDGSHPLYPKIATIGPYCAFIRRSALDLLGPLDDRRQLPQALARAATRLREIGMVHIGADDVAVSCDDTPDPPIVPTISPLSSRANATSMALDEERGSLGRAWKRGRLAQRRLSLTIDGRALTPAVGGTQSYTLALIRALGREPRLDLRVLVEPVLPEHVVDVLADLPQVGLITPEQAQRSDSRSDVVHRPQQIFDPIDYAVLRSVGERLVITHQDLIAYHNFSYHRNLDAWRRYRDTTRVSLAAAEQVIFFSRHALHDAMAEDLLQPDRAHIVGIGDPFPEPAGESAIPELLEPDDSFMLCLGADYAHKNRPFAIRLLLALRDLGWSGRLVLAGPHVSYGSSHHEERLIIAERPELAANVVDLGAVDEPTRRWLFKRARAVLYPSVYEGYGLLPLEASRAGLPCIYAPQASLSEWNVAATIMPWDATATAHAVLPLLLDGPSRDAHLAKQHDLDFPDWQTITDHLLEIYELAATGPASTSSLLSPERECALLHDLDYHRQVAQEYQDAYHDLNGRIRAGLPLIDRGGLLTLPQQRGLIRLAAHRRLARLILGPLGLLGRVHPRRQGRSAFIEDEGEH